MTIRENALLNVLFIASLVIFSLVMLGGMLVHVMPHFGWIIDGVRSGSMSPALERGSLIIARPVSTAEIALGDIVVFRNDNMADSYICHRVIAKTIYAPLLFDTKGDANPFPDPEPVRSENIVARVVWDMPVLGFAAIFIKTPVGFVISVIVPGIIIAIMCLSTIFSEISGNRKKADKTS